MNNLNSRPFISQVEKSVLELSRVSLELHRLNKFFECEVKLSLVQFCVLRHLVDMPGTSAQTLAGAVGVHPSTLTQSIRRLALKEYLFVDEDPLDSRRKIISITRRGKNALDQAIEFMRVSFSKSNTLARILQQIKIITDLE